MKSFDRRVFLSATLATSLLSTRALAAFPERPITIIVPYGAGGTGDTILRFLAGSMERRLGKPLIIDTRGGGGGMIGAKAVSGSDPDGHTLLLGATNNFVINQFMLPKAGFDPMQQFELITRVAIVPSVIYANPSLPIQTFGDFIAYAKANPGKLNYASPGVGTTPHLAVERLKQVTGIDIAHVPYRGGPEALQGVVQNDVQLLLGGWGTGRALVQAGQLRALAVASEKRLAEAPDLPTAIESLPGFVADNWWGLAAPKGTPRATIDLILAALQEALQDKAALKKFDELGLLVGGETPEQFTRNSIAEATMWKDIIAKGGFANTN
ncbi:MULTISPECIES: tripartite tricarboxylate transporter substrate binding protein [unclassified Beijerinckia]|uniref:Bug family tripartite tricarboxylate transporter substrate binding protein n=1 Tax=unclassified Beijerinckia TaxID=2638183 RepID=UPI000894A70D|nr:MULTISPECIES: tripartite tricarboxylate transporter substrate binding protein [unclassified Beijerinckia]MDH7798282.1 tripartite-type tricarboxylate transporter receptor subunit TctC [Beijerinckia sp. GAS462]SED15538.1 Tripartite-type tricarboxylate transporter, receptor component TctC [Beijerinckia sp. 28-YEA-48]